LTPGGAKKVLKQGGGGGGTGRRRRERKSYIDGVEMGEEGVERGWKKYLIVRKFAIVFLLWVWFLGGGGGGERETGADVRLVWFLRFWGLGWNSGEN